MEKIKDGVNGFGRIGRTVFRASRKFENIEIVGINDLQDADYLAYQLQYDSTHGIFGGVTEIKDNNRFVDRRPVTITSEKDPSNLNWATIGAGYICESTGFFLTTASATQEVFSILHLLKQKL